MFYNRILADKKPYFFRYKYKQLAKEYNDYIKKNDQNCQIHYGMTLQEIQSKPKEELNGEQQSFLMYLDKYLPVVDSDCVMNNICKYIEGIDFHIKQKVRSDADFDYKVLISKNFTPNRLLLRQISEVIEKHFELWNLKTKNKIQNKNQKQNGMSAIQERELEYQALKNELLEVTSNEEQLANHLVYYFYIIKPSASKATMWNIAGRWIYENIRQKKVNQETNTLDLLFPIKDENGGFEFQYNKYQIKMISIPCEEIQEGEDFPQEEKIQEDI